QDRDAQSNAGNNHSETERKQRQRNVIGNINAGLISQHGDEMRRPDSASCRGAGQADPGKAKSAIGSVCTSKQTNGRNTCEKTHAACERDQAQIMLAVKAT